MGCYQNISGLFAGVEIYGYTNNNPPADIQTSKLGVSHICCLSELGLFDFNIQFHLGKTTMFLMP